MKKKLIKSIPNGPGLYLFKDANNDVIYIGKAKCLKNRVRSYFQKTNDWKIASLLEDYVDIEFIVTAHETEAMLLEAELVKRYQPKYNVLLKSGQPFLYILFTVGENPSIKIVRSKKERGSYFGPFLHKTQARRVYNFLSKTFRLVRCNAKIATGCLKYHLGYCPGNCRPDFDMQDYLFRMQLAKDVLSNNHDAFLDKLRNRIDEYSKKLEFENAKQMHEYVTNFEIIFKTIKMHFSPEKYIDQVMHVTMPNKLKLQQEEDIAQKIQCFLQADNPIRVIDCFDISHFQSRHMVGSCIRFVDGKPEKSKFRRFIIKSLQEQNDYAALKEIVERRYRSGDYPDLIIIDGGKGQLNAVLPVVQGIPCISIAKREETVFSSVHPKGILIDVNTAIGKIIISLRDYAHHFAISFHRLKSQYIE